MKTFVPRKNIRGPILPNFILARPLTSGAKILYALLCDYAGDKDHCWPSHSLLSGRLGCSVGSIKNYLSELVHENLVLIRKEQYRSCVHYLILPEDADKPQGGKFDDTQAKIERMEANFERVETNFGYLNNLKKQRKEDPPHPPTVPRPEPSTVPSIAPAAGGVSFSPVQDFESTWNLYPRKEAKGFARMAWFKLLRSGELPSLSEIHAAIRRFAASESWQREQGRFVPQLGNWLRGQRWLDPLPFSPENRTRAEGSANQRAIQAAKARDDAEREKARENAARLRPAYEAFAAKFPPAVNDAMPFGTWLYLHSQNRAPSASDVPDDNTLGLIDFLNKWKRTSRQAAPVQAPPVPTAAVKARNAEHSTKKPVSAGRFLASSPLLSFIRGEGFVRPSEQASAVYA